MKQCLLSQVASCCLLAALGSAPASAVPEGAASAIAAPVTRGLEVNADSGVAAGSQLRLTLEGSAGGEATARLPGSNILLPLKEVAPGQYAGRYTVRPTDRIDPSAVIRVTLTAANQTTVANYTFPPSFRAPVAATAVAPIARAVVTAAPRPAVGQLAPMVVIPTPLRIERFSLAPVGRAEAGAELLFRLNGASGGTASFDIPGIVSNVPMRELRPGFYEGSYTIRRQDNLVSAGLVTATLRATDNRVMTATLSQPLVGDNRPPQIGSLLPRQGEPVPSGPTQVSGSFDDASGAGVDPRSVRIVLSGRDVTGQARVTPREFSLTAMLPPGRHTVEVVAADRAGNVAQKTWSFDVGASMLGAASAVLPLLVLSHGNNAPVDDTLTTIRGRTAPGAILRVTVDAVLAGPATQLWRGEVVADANGDFNFSFNPRYTRDNATSLPVPGTRYEVSITAHRDNQTAESRLMLFQRG